MRPANRRFAPRAVSSILFRPRSAGDEPSGDDSRSGEHSAREYNVQVIQLLGSTLGIALMSGVNLYATVLTIGLGTRLGFIDLPSQLSGLEVLSNPLILIVAGVMYAVEFFVDKIPWLDSLWDAIHTVIRPVGAALITVAAFAQVDPTLQVLAVLLSGGVSLTSHSAKAGTRLLANQSPEPVSNIALSTAEDAAVIGGSVFVMNHPVTALVIVGVFVLLFAIFAPPLIRVLKFEALAIGALLDVWFGLEEPGGSTTMTVAVPEKFRPYLPDLPRTPAEGFVLSCFSGSGMKGGRNRAGFLGLNGDALFFVSKRFLTIRKQTIRLSEVKAVDCQTKLLYSRLVLHLAKKSVSVSLLRNQRAAGERAAELIRSRVSQYSESD